MLNFLPGKKTYVLLALGAFATVLGGVIHTVDPGSQYAVPWDEVLQRIYGFAIGTTIRKAVK